MIALEGFSFLYRHIIKENADACNDSSCSLNESNCRLSLLSSIEPIVNDQDAVTGLNSVCVGFNFKNLGLTRVINAGFLEHVFNIASPFIQIATFACHNETSVKQVGNGSAQNKSSCF